MHVHCLCGGSEPEDTSGRKDFILGPRLGGGGRVFSSLQGGNRKFFKIFKIFYGKPMFFRMCFQFQDPLMVMNDTSLSTNDSKTKYSNSIHQ